jgi:20S proteasome subunit beta 3
MSIFSYNGGAVVAMKGKDCVAIACDKRLGLQMQTVAVDFEKIFELAPTTFIGLAGLATDVQTVSERIRFRTKLYEYREQRAIRPNVLLNMVSNMLYERRFGYYFIEPVIAMLDPLTGEPFVASCDNIGCPMVPKDFALTGTCNEELYGMCEQLWEPNLEAPELFETISQALLNALDRDAGSGWGVTVYLLEKDKVTVRTLKARMD